MTGSAAPRKLLVEFSGGKSHRNGFLQRMWDPSPSVPQPKQPYHPPPRNPGTIFPATTSSSRCHCCHSPCAGSPSSLHLPWNRLTLATAPLSLLGCSLVVASQWSLCSHSGSPKSTAHHWEPAHGFRLTSNQVQQSECGHQAAGLGPRSSPTLRLSYCALRDAGPPSCPINAPIPFCTAGSLLSVALDSPLELAEGRERSKEEPHGLWSPGLAGFSSGLCFLPP